MNQGNVEFSPTGRLLRHHGQSVSHTMSFSRLTPVQRELLTRLAGEPLVVNGRSYSTSELNSCFNGHQLPRDPDALRLMDLDFSGIESRIQASGAQTYRKY